MAGSRTVQEPKKIELSKPRRIHVIGAGGSGMSAIARVLLAMGHTVSGSDKADSAALRGIAAAGATTWVGSDPKKIKDLDAVAVSTAIPAGDAEMAAARKAGIPVLNRSVMLPSIAKSKRTIAVAGTHGKTTTSTLLAHVLEAGGLDPSWIIGGEITGRQGGAHWSKGDWFIAEADESDATFLRLGAEAAIVTNIEPDHLETYGGWEELKAAFGQFIASASGPKVMCADDPDCAALARLHTVPTYGFADDADYRVSDMMLGRDRATFVLRKRGGEKAMVELATTGAHNVSNAAAALALGNRLGISLKEGAKGIAAFEGVGRRFQARGTARDVTFVDDYAHLPSEVRAALAAAKAGKWRRIVAVFQPHRYSRTEQVGEAFGDSFDDADLLFLTDVYAAGEAPRPGVDGTLIKKAVGKRSQSPRMKYVAERSRLAEQVGSELRPGDLCLTLGAGDVTNLATEIQDFWTRTHR